MSMADNIKRLRIEHGLSQKELAIIAGVTDKAVSTWESLGKIPRMGAIQKIADYFHIKKSDIIEDTPDIPTSIPAPNMSKREQKHMEQYHQLTEDNKNDIDKQTDKLLRLQNLEEDNRRQDALTDSA